MTPSAISASVRLLREEIALIRAAAKQYARMGRDDHEKAFERGRAADANQHADDLQSVVDHLLKEGEKQHEAKTS